MLEKRVDETVMQFMERQETYETIRERVLANIRQVASWADAIATMEGQLWVVNGKVWTPETLGLSAEETAEIAAVLRGGVLLRQILVAVANPAVTTAEIEAFEAALVPLLGS